MNKESLQVLSIANQSIKESQNIWSADKVSDLVDDMEETKSVAREINDLIASANRSYMSDLLSEQSAQTIKCSHRERCELEELLASLGSETKENEIVNQIASLPEMPVVPTNIIQSKQENDMVRELEGI